MITTITQVLLLLLIILQMIVAVYMLVNTRQQYKKDKAFYEQLCKNLKEQQAVFLNQVEGGVQCEQPEETEDKK